MNAIFYLALALHLFLGILTRDSYVAIEEGGIAVIVAQVVDDRGGSKYIDILLEVEKVISGNVKVRRDGKLPVGIPSAMDPISWNERRVFTLRRVEDPKSVIQWIVVSVKK